MGMGSQVRITAERVDKAVADMHQLIPKTYGPRERRAMCESAVECYGETLSLAVS